MSRRAVLRTVAGVVALAVAGVALLVGEAFYAASRAYVTDAPPSSGGAPDPRLRIAVLGDSTAVGLGVDSAGDTVGGRLAASLPGPVAWRSYGVSGARVADLTPQVDQVLAGERPDLVVILIGANDATHFTGLDSVERDLERAVGRLRGAGLPVVVGTAPDMGAARALLPPLRQVVAARGRAVADAERRAVLAAGGVPVDLAAKTGPAFRADPGMLSRDEFHPSAKGYALWAETLLPAVREALPDAA